MVVYAVEVISPIAFVAGSLRRIPLPLREGRIVFTVYLPHLSIP
jgi:hypothetical protein